MIRKMWSGKGQKLAGGIHSLVARGSKKLTNPKGFGLASLLLACVALGAVMIPVSKWFLSMDTSVSNMSERLEMQSIVQDMWNRLNANTYDEFTELMGGAETKTINEQIPATGEAKWHLVAVIGKEGTYTGAACESSSPSPTESRCRKVAMTVTSATDTTIQPYSLETTKITTPAESQRLKDMETNITNLQNKIPVLEQKISEAAASGGYIYDYGDSYGYCGRVQKIGWGWGGNPSSSWTTGCYGIYRAPDEAGGD